MVTPDMAVAKESTPLHISTRRLQRFTTSYLVQISSRKLLDLNKTKHTDQLLTLETLLYVNGLSSSSKAGRWEPSIFLSPWETQAFR